MNTTKILAGLMLVMYIMAFASPLVLAEDEPMLISDSGDVDVDLPEPGIGPESAMYGFENGWDKLRLAFTFNKEKKIQKAIEIAEERLAEAEAASDSELAEKARLRYNEFIAKAEETLEKIQAQKEEQAEDALQRTIRVQERIEAHEQKVTAVHNRILEGLGSGNATEEQIAHLEEVFGKIQERAEKAQEKVLQRQETLRARYKVYSGKTDEEIDTMLEEYRTNVTQAREQIREKIKERINQTSDDDEDNDSEEDDSDDDEGNESSGQGEAIKLGQSD